MGRRRSDIGRNRAAEVEARAIWFAGRVEAAGETAEKLPGMAHSRLDMERIRRGLGCGAITRGVRGIARARRGRLVSFAASRGAEPRRRLGGGCLASFGMPETASATLECTEVHARFNGSDERGRAENAGAETSAAVPARGRGGSAEDRDDGRKIGKLPYLGKRRRRGLASGSRPHGDAAK